MGERLLTHHTQQAANQSRQAGSPNATASIVTHGRDGKIRSKDSYGNDPNPPKDTEH